MKVGRMTDDTVQFEEVTIGQRLIALKDRSGLSLARIATAAGYQAASSIQKLFRPDYSPPRLSQNVADRLIVALEGRGYPPIVRDEITALVEGRDAKEHFNQEFTRLMRHEKDDIPIYRSQVSLRKVRAKDDYILPVFGLSVAQMPERFEAPSHLALRDVAGFRVISGNMWPKYDLDELIWYSEADTARIGDVVMVALGAEREDQTSCYLLGRLLDRNDEEIRLSQLSPERVNVIAKKTVTSVRRILTYEDLMPVHDGVRF